jgi:hypothetical protein
MYGDEMVMPIPATNTRQKWTIVSDAIPAKFAGHCHICNLAIHEGQIILKLDNETWVHEWCPESEPIDPWETRANV